MDICMQQSVELERPLIFVDDAQLLTKAGGLEYNGHYLSMIQTETWHHVDEE